jgi:hypothetical protein
VWVLPLELGGPYSDIASQVLGVFKHYHSALQTAVPAIRDYGMGEDEDDEMYFEDAKGLENIAEKDGDKSAWRFEDSEGDFVNVDVERMQIQ